MESGVLPNAARLPQDLSIEILSYLNLPESNSLAHVNHDWLKASQVERRRLVELTWEMVRRCPLPPETAGTPAWTILRHQVIRSPLARLITHLPRLGIIEFDNQEAITTAVNNFPNLLLMVIELPHSSEDTLHSLTQPFHLPSRLANITFNHNSLWPVACDQQQFYLDSLSTATQLHTVELREIDPTINLSVLTRLPLLTDLTIRRVAPRSFPLFPLIPDHILQTLSSLKALVSLHLGWRFLPDQWSRLRLPHLQYISLADGEGVNSSSDLVPLMNTVMAKSLRRLRLRLDAADSDLTNLLDLVKFTQLDQLVLWRRGVLSADRELTEKDMRDIYAALIQLKSLTSLKMNIYPRAGKAYKMNVSELLAAAPHLTALELKDSFGHSMFDFNFLQSPLAHQRLIDLNVAGYFSHSDIFNGILQCQQLRRLELRCSCVPTPNEWWEELKVKLDSRGVLPTLDQLNLILTDDTYLKVFEHLQWERFTGSASHPSFRMRTN